MVFYFSGLGRVLASAYHLLKWTAMNALEPRDWEKSAPTSRPALVAVWCVLCIVSSGCGGLARSILPEQQSRRAKPEVAWLLIASYSTRFDASEVERTENISKAALALDDHLISSESRFSFNHQVGRRTIASGYRVAPVLTFEGKRPALGGGICQVSTTVYNALLLAGFEVVERHPHSRPIRYVPLGRDATVSWGSKDLILQNPHPFAVRVSVQLFKGRLIVRAFAPRKLPVELRLETADHEPATPRKELQVLDNPERLAVGGVWVRLYRHHVVDGSTVRTERIGGSSFYPYRLRGGTR